VRLLRIRVHNFKCFKDAELNLRNYESITVIGPNGAGKSTLVIDSLTWCIYGHTSLTDLKGYKQDDLVRTGEKECYVEVEFELGGDIYVIRRTFNLTRRAALLDVFLNRKRLDLKVKDAERFLAERIGLDYEGFVNSTIIRQEEMKRLISEDPSRRKDIFISLFRLGIYEEALQKTKNDRTEAEKKLGEIKASLVAKEELLGQEKDWIEKSRGIDSKIKELEKERIEVESSLRELGATISRLEQSVNKLIIDETKLDGIRARMEANEKKLKDNNFIRSESQERLDDCSQKAKDAEELRKDYEAASAMRDRYGVTLHQKEMLEQLIRIRLEQENSEIDRLNKEHESLLEQKESITKEINEASSGLSTPILVKEHRESINKLEESAINLGRIERGLDIGKSANDYGVKKSTDLSRSVTESKQRLGSARKAVDQTLSKLVSELPKLSVSETKMKAIIERIDEVSNSLYEKQKALKDESLSVGELDGRGQMSLMDTKQLLRKCADQIDRLICSGYDPSSFDELKKRAEDASNAREELAKIKVKIASAESAVESLTKEQDTLKEESSDLQKGIETSQSIRQEYQKAKANHSEIQKRYTDLKAEIEGLRKQREEIETNLNSIAGHKATIKDLGSKQKALEREISDYRRLEPVFHRDGIPSAILKRIIPRVASESSSILAQLSSGRYDAVTIEEQEDGKLNIWVKDGEAKYGVHRFSGGEKVRIALAVRLAVSKVLSELPEAGKRLSRMKTLIIDEGDLGSLDGEGLNSTIEIINELTKLFGLTILISHLEAVKGWAGGNYAMIERGELGANSRIEYS
jgi:exonuclease SbcC